MGCLRRDTRSQQWDGGESNLNTDDVKQNSNNQSTLTAARLQRQPTPGSSVHCFLLFSLARRYDKLGGVNKLQI